MPWQKDLYTDFWIVWFFTVVDEAVQDGYVDIQ